MSTIWLDPRVSLEPPDGSIDLKCLVPYDQLRPYKRPYHESINGAVVDDLIEFISEDTGGITVSEVVSSVLEESRWLSDAHLDAAQTQLSQQNSVGDLVPVCIFSVPHQEIPAQNPDHRYNSYR